MVRKIERQAEASSSVLYFYLARMSSAWQPATHDVCRGIEDPIRRTPVAQI